MAVSHQSVSDEAAEAERTLFPPCSSHSSVGGNLPFGEDNLRAFRDEMWSDEIIYVSHLTDDTPQPRRLDFTVPKAKEATSPSQVYAPLPPTSSDEYRTRYEAVNTYHDVNHRSS